MELHEQEIFTLQELRRAIYSDSRRFTLYRLYDEDDNLLYVGITRELEVDREAHETPLERRLRKHRKSGIPRKWTRVVSEDFGNLFDALKAERSYVRRWFPKWRVADWNRPERTPVLRQQPGQRTEAPLPYPRVSGRKQYRNRAVQPPFPGHGRPMLPLGSWPERTPRKRRAQGLSELSEGRIVRMLQRLGRLEELGYVLSVKARRKARLDGLDEILAEVDGRRPMPEIDVEKLTDEQRSKFNECLSERVAAAVSDAAPAVPWGVALGLVGRVLERPQKLTEKERSAVGMQLAILLKRVRFRGVIESGAKDRVDGKRKAEKFTQKRAAEICGISERSLRSLEDAHENGYVPSQTTLCKVYAGLSRFPAESPDEPARDHEWEWNVYQGREILEHYLSALYREWCNVAYRDVRVRREGYLWDVARYKRGSWEDQAQEGFLRIWGDAGYKRSGDEDKRKKHDPVEFLEGYEREWDEPPLPWPDPEEDHLFEAWARRRANVGVSQERRKEYKRGEWEMLVGEEGLQDALQENARPGEPDHDTPFRKGGLEKEAQNRYIHQVVVGYATPQRRARVGETRKLYPIRRRLLPAPPPPTERPELPDWAEGKRNWQGHKKDWTPAELEEYERRYCSHDWRRPDDWKTLGSYPVSRPLLDNVIWPAGHYFPTKTSEEWTDPQKPIDHDKRRDFLKIYKTGLRLDNVKDSRSTGSAWKARLEGEDFEDAKGMYLEVALEDGEDESKTEGQ